MALACSNCGNELTRRHYNADTFIPCDACNAKVRAMVFPSLFRPVTTGSAGRQVLEERQSSCFFHPKKQAATVCDQCGRFLCDLCDIPLDHRHLCPPCVETARAGKKMPDLEKERVLYDNVALALAVLPMLFVFITCITAPMALYVAVRYWKAPGSLLPRTRYRFVLAAIIASAQMAGWGILIFEWAMR